MGEKILTYEFLINEFGEEKIADRYKYLYAKLYDYLKAKCVENDVIINDAILKQVLLDYFTDIYRLKKFHQIENVNLIKIVSYTAYWLLRRKPLQSNNTSNKNIVFINEGFTVFFLMHEFLVPDEKLPLTKSDELKLKEYIDQLYYYLKYRTIDKQYLEMMFCSFEAGKIFD